LQISPNEDKEPIDNEVLIHDEPLAFHNLEELRL